MNTGTYTIDGESIEEIMNRDYQELAERHRQEVEKSLTIKILNQYIELLEAERDYYREGSSFAGVPNTPWPKDTQNGRTV